MFECVAKLIIVSTTFSLLVVNTVEATPSGQKCTLDISPPQTHASASIAADALPATVCFSGWFCYHEDEGYDSDLEQETITREFPKYDPSIGLNDELGHVRPDLGTEDFIYEESVAILKAKKNRNNLIKVWELNPLPGQTINDKMYCYTKFGFKGLQKLEHWAALYKSQYDSHIKLLKKKKDVFRKAYNALTVYWILDKEKHVLEGKEATILQSLRTAQWEREYYNGQSYVKEKWKKKYDNAILELKNKLTSVATEIDAYKKKHLNQNSAKLQSEKSSIVTKLQRTLKYRNNPPKDILQRWKNIASAQKELEKQQQKLINVQSNLRTIYNRIKAMISSVPLYKQQYNAAWGDYKNALDDFQSPLIGDAYPDISTHRRYNTLEVSISRKSNHRKTNGKKKDQIKTYANETPSKSTTGQENSPSSFQCSFGGTWTSDWGDMVFHQKGSSVKAIYTHDAGKIDGTVNGNKLTGYWTEAPSYNIHSMDGGNVIFTLSADCKSFFGQWRYGTHGDWLGTWSAKRKLGSHISNSIKRPVVKKNQKELLQDQLNEIKPLKDKLKNLQQQWAVSMETINEQRAKGEDVTGLKQNLMHIRVQQQQARKRLEKLNSKYGTSAQIQKKIDALDLAKKVSPPASDMATKKSPADKKPWPKVMPRYIPDGNGSWLKVERDGKGRYRIPIDSAGPPIPEYISDGKGGVFQVLLEKDGAITFQKLKEKDKRNIYQGDIYQVNPGVAPKYIPNGEGGWYKLEDLGAFVVPSKYTQKQMGIFHDRPDIIRDGKGNLFRLKQTRGGGYALEPELKGYVRGNDVTYSAEPVVKTKKVPSPKKLPVTN